MSDAAHADAPDLPADATTDAPAGPPALGLVFDDGFGALPRFTFHEMAPGDVTGITLLVRNPTAVATGPLQLEITGDAGLTLDARGTCVAGLALVPGDQCWVRVVWTAGAPGTAHAVLHVTDGAGVSDLPIVAPSAAPPPGLAAHPGSIDFGVTPQDPPVGVPDPRFTTITITNHSTVRIRAGATSAPFGVTLESFPSDGLAPGASVVLAVSYSAAVPGPMGGVLTVATDGAPLEIPVHAFGSYAVTVTSSGSPAARVSSIPRGIECASTADGCSGEAIGPVTLRATSLDGAPLLDWAAGLPTATCGRTPTCTVRPALQANDTDLAPFGQLGVHVVARFASASTRTVHVTIAGTGRGFVHAQLVVADGTVDLGACEASCDLQPPDGVGGVVLRAFSPDHFHGWTAPSLPDPDDRHVLALGINPAPVSVTATFDADPSAAASLTPTIPAAKGAWTRDGHLIVGGGNVVSKLALDGTVLWTKAIRGVSPVGRLRDLEVSGTGDIAVVNEGVLSLLSSDGETLWNTVLPGQAGPDPYGAGFQENPYTRLVAAATNGDLAIWLGDPLPPHGGKIVTLHRDGSPAWTATDPLPILGIAAGPAGTIVAAVGPTFAPMTIRRYDAAGTKLADLGQLPGDAWYGAITANAAGDVATSMTIPAFGADTHAVCLLEGDGTVGFTKIVPIGRHDETTDGVQAGVALDASGDVVTIREADPIARIIGHSGFQLERWSRSGTKLYSLVKSRDPRVFETNLVSATWIAADANHHVAIGGTSNDRPWVEILTFP